MSDAVSMLYPIRRGSRIFVRINGEDVEIDPMQATLIARRWFEALTGAYVYKTVNDEHD